MVSKLLIAWSLLALCVVVHAVGMTLLMRYGKAWGAQTYGRFWFSTWLLVRTAGWITLLHLLEIAIWGFFYAWTGSIGELPAALYFSAVTYTTTGYGDVLLPEGWRLLGGIEALTGILMSGWSAAFFFAVVSRMQQAPPQPNGA